MKQPRKIDGALVVRSLGATEELFWRPDSIGGVNITFTLKGHGILEQSHVTETLDEIQRLYYPLRLGIRKRKNRAFFVELDKKIGCRFLSLDDVDTRSEEYREISTPFNCEDQPLFRLAAIALPNDQYCLILVFHHSLFDGHAARQFSIEFTNCLFGDAKPRQLPLLSPSYHELLPDDCIGWAGFRSFRKAARKHAHNETKPTFSFGRPTDVKPACLTKHGCHFCLDADQTIEFSRLCKERKISENALLYAALTKAAIDDSNINETVIQLSIPLDLRSKLKVAPSNYLQLASSGISASLHYTDADNIFQIAEKIRSGFFRCLRNREHLLLTPFALSITARIIRRLSFGKRGTERAMKAIYRLGGEGLSFTYIGDTGLKSRFKAHTIDTAVTMAGYTANMPIVGVATITNNSLRMSLGSFKEYIDEGRLTAISDRIRHLLSEQLSL